MPGIIRKLGQVGLPVRNLERAILFYRDILGLPYIWSDAHMAFFEVADTRLIISIPESPVVDHPGSVLYFDVANIDEAVVILGTRGVVFNDAPHHIGNLGDIAVWMTFFHDTEDNLLALQCERPIR